MNWKETDKSVLYFNYNSFYYYKTNNRIGEVFSTRFWANGLSDRGYLYPKMDLSSVENFETKTIKPESKLFFDPGSSFPRFKLTVSGNKRCIKQSKADIIVVSGNTNYTIPSNNYIVLEDDMFAYIMLEDDWTMWFNGRLDKFINDVSPFKQFNNLSIAHIGKVMSFDKDSLYLPKYALGSYNLPYITDNNLDKVICDMCPEPTYEEVLSLIDMLDSEDASVVQLGVKMLTGFNVEKYKLTLRLILYTRSNWFTFTRNTVGTKQLIDTLEINHYRIGDDFGYAVYAENPKETYTVEDIALAKKISTKLIRDWLQKKYNDTFARGNYKWLPDEKRINIE